MLTLEQIEQEKNSHYMKDSIPVDWEQLDEETAPLLERIARDIYDGTASEIGRPERVSERLIYRELGLAQHRLENMPKCKAIFGKYTESYAENWARKIIWGYQKLQNEREDIFYWSDIRQLTGVKKRMLKHPQFLNTSLAKKQEIVYNHHRSNQRICERPMIVTGN